MENILHVVFSTSCLFVWVFIKILKQVKGLLRKQGIHLVIYLDDFLLMAPTKEILSYQVTLTVTLLEMFGFVVSYQKSQLNHTIHGGSGFPYKFNYTKYQPSLGSIRKECQKVVENPCRHQDKRASSAPRETKCFDPGSIPSTPSLSSHPRDKNDSILIAHEATSPKYAGLRKPSKN